VMTDVIDFYEFLHETKQSLFRSNPKRILSLKELAALALAKNPKIWEVEDGKSERRLSGEVWIDSRPWRYFLPMDLVLWLREEVLECEICSTFFIRSLGVKYQISGCLYFESGEECPWPHRCRPPKFADLCSMPCAEEKHLRNMKRKQLMSSEELEREEEEQEEEFQNSRVLRRRRSRRSCLLS
jgi:hypothetical protein